MRLIRHIKTFNPRWVINAVTIAVIVVNFNYHRWSRNAVITPEVSSFYAYLPAYFYHNNDGLSFLDANPSATPGQDCYAPVATANGNYVISRNMGMALSYLPFFGMAHVYASLAGHETDGYSAPYQFAIQFSSLVYFVIGMIFLAKLLRLHFPGLVSSVTLLCLAFGTNIFFYLTTGGGMPHAVSFMLTVLFLYQTVSWYQMRDLPSAAQAGLLLGALWLVRPVNILLVLVFLLYDLRRWSKVKTRMKLFLLKPKHLLLMFICCLLVILPQFIYWKIQTGDFFFDLYSSDTFQFTNPRIFMGFFNFGNGWLIYSPLMALSIAGLLLLRGGLRMYAWAIPVFAGVYILLIFSCWCWWQGPSFGQRSLIDIYPVLAIPFAAFVYKLRRLGGWYKRSLYFLIMVLLAVNLFLSLRTADRFSSDLSEQAQMSSN